MALIAVLCFWLSGVTAGIAFAVGMTQTGAWAWAVGGMVTFLLLTLLAIAFDGEETIVVARRPERDP